MDRQRDRGVVAGRPAAQDARARAREAILADRRPSAPRARLALAVGAAGAGAGGAWLASSRSPAGSLVLMAGAGIALAVMNGYAKAYSP